MSANRMRAAYMQEKGRITVETADVPAPAAHEVLIRLKAVGVCGSDVHLFSHGGIGDFKVTPPYMLGHEAAGEVAALGTGVDSLQVGDRIVMEPGVPCGSCEFCLSGRYNLCPEMKFWAAPPVQGVLCEYTAHPAAFCFKIKDSVGFDVGSLAEPLSVGVYAAQRAGVGPGKTVAILGMGPIGQTALQAVLGFGATAVMVSDIVESRLELARQLRAQLAVNGGTGDLAARGSAFTSAKGFDIIIETSGSPRAFSDAVNIAKNGATIVLIGSLQKLEPDVPMIKAVFKELRILGSYRYCNMYPIVVDILASNPSLKRLITHHFPLEKVQQAFEFVRDHKDDCMKVIIDI
jgi:L-iditol 2-dehydrogenase